MPQPTPDWVPVVNGQVASIYIDFLNNRVWNINEETGPLEAAVADIVPANPSQNFPGWFLTFAGAFSQDGISNVCLSPLLLQSVNFLLNKFGGLTIIAGTGHVAGSDMKPYQLYTNRNLATEGGIEVNIGQPGGHPPGSSSSVAAQFTSFAPDTVLIEDITLEGFSVDNAVQSGFTFSDNQIAFAWDGGNYQHSSTLTSIVSIDVFEVIRSYEPRVGGGGPDTPSEGATHFIAIFGPMDEGDLTSATTPLSGGQLGTTIVPPVSIPLICVPCCACDIGMCNP